MRRFLLMFSVLCVVLIFAACAEGNETVTETPTPEEMPTEVPDVPPPEITSAEPEIPPPFEGKIAIITNDPADDPTWETALPIVNKYGSDKVIHATWPPDYMAYQEGMVHIVSRLSADPEVKAIIINQPLIGTNRALEKLRETREDILVICCAPYVNTDDTTQLADIILMTDELSMGPAMVRQAQILGVKTFVHYSFPRRMTQPLPLRRRDLIKEACVNLGLEFVEKISLDPMDFNSDIIWQSVLEDVAKMAQQYGKDTAFFSTDCAAQIPLIKAVVDNGAIYPQPCHQYNELAFFLLSLDISVSQKEYEEMTTQDKITRISTVLAKKDMLGRISSWPIADYALFTITAAEYAIKWINGEVPKEGVDVEVLKQLMEDYAGVEVFLTPYTDEYPYTNEGTGQTFDNFLLMRMDYITF